MICVKSASFVFFLLFLAVVTINASYLEESKHHVSSSVDTSNTKHLNKPLDVKPELKSTAKELIARRRKKFNASNPDKDEFFNAGPKISKINLKNRNKPDLPLHKFVLNEHPRLKELEDKIRAFRSHIKAPTLQARLAFPDHENIVEKIKEKQEEIKSKHKEFENKLKMAHLKFPILQDLKEDKEEKIVGSRNAIPLNTDTHEKKHVEPKNEAKPAKHPYHHMDTDNATGIKSEKPVIILDHRNGESKIKSTMHANVVKTNDKLGESVTSKFEGALEKLKEIRLDKSSKLKEKIDMMMPNLNKTETLVHNKI